MAYLNDSSLFLSLTPSSIFYFSFLPPLSPSLYLPSLPLIPGYESDSRSHLLPSKSSPALLASFCL